MTDADPRLADTAALLGEVFPGAARIGDERYLEWLYTASPHGRVVQANRVDDAGLSAHYAVVPIELQVAGDRVPGALSLNTAVSERARGGGLFVALATETYELARARGVRVITGVANANSTPGFERRLGFTNHGPLPANVLVPTAGRSPGITSGPAATADRILAEVDALAAPDGAGWTRRWDSDSLRWRLASPGAHYAVHRSADALVVTTSERRPGATVAIVLAAFAARPLAPREVRALTRAICRFHRAPLALHVGFNDRVPFRGVPLPERLRPSPLNLITRALDSTAVPAPSRFEFLDFDAY